MSSGQKAMIESLAGVHGYFVIFFIPTKRFHEKFNVKTFFDNFFVKQL